MTREALEVLDHIRRSPGLFTGQFPDEVIAELSRAGMIEMRWVGPEAMFGLSRVYVSERAS